MTAVLFVSISLAAPLVHAGQKKPKMVRLPGMAPLPATSMTEKSETEGKTKFEFRVYPRILTITPNSTSAVFVHLRIENPGEKYHCLGVRFEIGGVNQQPSFKSGRQDMSCPPYSEVAYSEGDGANYSPDRPLAYPWDGVSNPIEVKVVLFSGDKDVLVMTQKLMVTGLMVPSSTDSTGPVMPEGPAPDRDNQ